jgi:hypothetical protein
VSQIDANVKPSLYPKVLAPGATLWAPVLPIPRLTPSGGSPSDIMIQLRTEQHEWCTPLAATHPHNTKLPAVTFFACNGTSDAIKPIAFSYTGSSKSSEGHQLPYTLYHLRTPIIVENLLAVSCIVDVLEQRVGGKTIEVGAKELARGDEYELQVTVPIVPIITVTYVRVCVYCDLADFETECFNDQCQQDHDYCGHSYSWGEVKAIGY